MKKISVKKALILLLTLSLFGSISVFVLASRSKATKYRTTKAFVGEIVQSVNETGTLKGVSELSLSFLNSGKIQRINYEVGDTIQEGKLVAELDYSGLIIKKNEAEANKEVAVQSLNKLISGSSAEEKKVAEANVNKAESAYLSAENELNTIKASASEAVSQAEKNLFDLESASNDNVTSYEQKIITAQINLENTKSSYQQSIDNYRSSALIAVEDKLSAANTALDAVNRVITDSDGEDYLSIENPAYLSVAKSTYNNAKIQYIVSANSLQGAKGSSLSEPIIKALDACSSLLTLSLRALENIFSALDNSVTSANFTQGDIDSHKSTISAQIIIINTALATIENSSQSFNGAILDYDNNVLSAKDSLSSAEAAYDLALSAARDTLSSTRLSTRQSITLGESKLEAAKEALELARAQKNQVYAAAQSHDILLSRAKIRQAQALLDSINKQIEDSQIIAPLSGQTTAVFYEVGEQIPSGKALISLLSDGDYKVEVLISEADIAKVKKNDKATISLDAFGEDIKFNGEVRFIEPAETIIQEVVYYLLELNIESGNYSLKPGMTANVEIITNKKENVLLIPGRSIINKGEQAKYVRLLLDNNVKEVKIITGIRGDSGLIEVLDGLKENDVIITSIIKK